MTLALLMILDCKHGRPEKEKGKQMLSLDFADIGQNTNIFGNTDNISSKYYY